MEAPPPSSTTESTGDPPPPQRFRIMCSYGGHIIPRPYDKMLSYIGGETRIVLIDRYLSLANLYAHLAKILNQKDPFLLKYQLPNDDLDSLISITEDEDLQNMIEEYDKLGNKQGRLRLFLFPKTVQSFDLGLVCGNKGSSDDWFMGVLNGKVKSLSAAFSDSLNCLIGLELDDGDDNRGDYVSKEGLLEGLLVENEKKLVSDGGIANEDVHSVPESPIIQKKSSSFGSTSSSKSIKVGGLGVDEQFQQMGVLGNSNLVDQKQQDLKDTVTGSGGGAHSVNRVIISDDERSDHGGGHRKVQEAVQQVQTTQQLQQRQASVGCLFELTSPESVSSEGSISNPMSRQRQAIHQEPTFVQIQSLNNKADANIMDQSNTKIQMQPPLQEPGYVLSGQYDQHHHATLRHPQQFVHPSTQYIAGRPIPVASYYPVYPSQHQNLPNQPTQPYPVYFIQASHSQALNVPISNPEAVSGGYRTLASTAPQLVQVPSSQHQSNYVNYAQIHHPSQSMAQSLANNKGVYAYEVSDPAHAQMYYAATAQTLAPPHVVAQYQTIVSSSAVSVPPNDASSQNLTENMKQQQVRTVQP